MRRTTASIAAASLALGLVVGAAQGDAGGAPARLKLVTAAPLVVRGSAFHPHERVRLVLRKRTGAPMTRHATADAAGIFTETFAGAKVGRCGGFSVVASGADGTRATLRRVLPLPPCSRGGA